MEINIVIPESTPRDLINLNDFILKQSIEGLQDPKIEQVPAGSGEMGPGIFESIKTLISAASKPLVELIKCLQKYADNYRTEIVIKTPDKDVTIKKGRAMTADEIQALVTEILKAK